MRRESSEEHETKHGTEKSNKVRHGHLLSQGKDHLADDQTKISTFFEGSKFLFAPYSTRQWNANGAEVQKLYVSAVRKREAGLGAKSKSRLKCWSSTKKPWLAFEMIWIPLIINTRNLALGSQQKSLNASQSVAEKKKIYIYYTHTCS